MIPIPPKNAGIGLIPIPILMPVLGAALLKHHTLMLYRKYITRGGVSWQIQHLAMPHGVFAT